MTFPGLTNGWGDALSRPKTKAHARSLVHGAERWAPTARQSLRYLGELLTLDCGPDMLALRLFPDAKEITESFAAFRCVFDKLKTFDLADPSVALIAVGDGGTPRTAATFAFRTKWQCYSVDPVLKGGTKSPRWTSIQRLTVMPQRIEEVTIEAERAVIVAVHSHANLARSVAAVRAKELAVVAMPCCVDLSIPGRAPDFEYEDVGVLSPQRTLKVWREVR